MGDLLRLIDHAPGQPADGQQGLVDWGKEWLDALTTGEYGKIRTVCILVENQAGSVGVITQSIGAIDTCRVIGLLTAVIHRKMADKNGLEELQNA